MEGAYWHKKACCDHQEERSSIVEYRAGSMGIEDTNEPNEQESLKAKRPRKEIP